MPKVKTDYFNRSWSNRIKEMSVHITPNESVLDLGCGLMELKKYLNGNVYYPVDYIARNSEVLIYDFNRKQFPKINADVSFVSGVLEYVFDYEWFIKQIITHSNKCIISYSITDIYNDNELRNLNMWNNHLSRSELINLFLQNGWKLKKEFSYPYFIFEKNLG